jgi:hypothetical protein
MLLILEIGLMIAAWQRGWKRLALLPLAFGVTAGFILGYFGGSDYDIRGVTLFIDFLCICSLIGMTIKSRKISKISSQIQNPGLPKQNVENSPLKY